MVWQVLTDPAHLSEWAPFDADRNLSSVGPAKLSTALCIHRGFDEAGIAQHSQVL